MIQKGDWVTRYSAGYWLVPYEPLIVRPDEATHVLYTFSYLWEVSADFDPLLFGPELRKYENKPGV